MPWDSVRGLLVCRTDATKVPSLPGEVSEIEGQDSDQQNLYVVYQGFVLDDVPAEVVPGIATSSALVCVPQPLPNVSLSNVDWGRAVVENVDALPAFTASWHVLDVRRVSCPHLAELVDECHRNLL